MKRKKILKVPFIVPEKMEAPKKHITAQVLDGRYLILDLWLEKKKIKCRHVTDLNTGEPATYYPDSGEWNKRNLNGAADSTYRYYWGYEIKETDWELAKEDADLIRRVTKRSYRDSAYGKVLHMEESYNRERREAAEVSKQRRLNELMEKCPRPGKKVYDWIAQAAVGDRHYAFYHKEEKTYHCTSCEGDFSEAAAGVKIRNKDEVTCPLCGCLLIAEKRRKSVIVSTRLTVIHNVDEKRGVERHFIVTIEWENIRQVYLEETIRLMMQRGMKHAMKIYYSDLWGRWTEGNRSNRRWKAGYLYPDREGIQEGLKGTDYEAWMEVLPMLAEDGIEANYNGLLVESNRYWTRIAEYMMKGRFYRLLKEESESISYWRGYVGDTLRINGETIEEVMMLHDRQMINRLRQENGGVRMLAWLQWSEESGKKISTECIKWLEEAGISPLRYGNGNASKYLSPEQLKNYISRQQAESYPKKKMFAVFEQYEDYLCMAAALDKKLDDALVYRPRELRRRHDELVEETHKKQELLQAKRDRQKAREEAKRMKEKYPGSEEILKEIKEKLEYSNGTYRIIVPKNFFEITMEGAALHHCAGATERYFDRIIQRETYICFLRRDSEPKVPYYTIEVEPGGTIRQHRGEWDEEPGIEQIKPFLKEWQKVIRSRMRGKDFEHAEKSAALRQKNMDELREKGNTRVLEGLIEDLMEVG